LRSQCRDAAQASGITFSSSSANIPESGASGAEAIRRTAQKRQPINGISKISTRCSATTDHAERKATTCGIAHEACREKRKRHARQHGEESLDRQHHALAHEMRIAPRGETRERERNGEEHQGRAIPHG
jgi:hypothetical protein